MLWQTRLGTIPLWFRASPGPKCILCTLLSTIVWSANDSSQRALTYSDLRVYVSLERGQPRCWAVWCLVPWDVNWRLSLSFNSHPGVCEESLNWLPVQLSCPTQRSSVECTVEHMSPVCGFVHSGGDFWLCMLSKLSNYAAIKAKSTYITWQYFTNYMEIGRGVSGIMRESPKDRRQQVYDTNR